MTDKIKTFDPSKPIASPQNTIAVLQETGFLFKKQLGQNFLIDLHVLEKIVKSAEIGPEDVCLEIGPGIGSLTEAMAKAARRVVAVEIDHRLIPILEKNLASYANVSVVESDFLKLDLPGFFARELTPYLSEGRGVKVAANLPYYITTPIIMSLLEARGPEGDPLPLENLTFMVQEEVAARMMAGPGTKDYGALSLAVQYYAEPYLAARVPQNCFIPRPGVSSAVIRLSLRKEPLEVTPQDRAFLFQVIRAAFQTRRKTLVNSLAGELHLEKERILAALEALSLSPTVRGEALSLAEFIMLSNELFKQKDEEKSASSLHTK